MEFSVSELSSLPSCDNSESPFGATMLNTVAISASRARASMNITELIMIITRTIFIVMSS